MRLSFPVGRLSHGERGRSRDSLTLTAWTQAEAINHQSLYDLLLCTFVSVQNNVFVLL